MSPIKIFDEPEDGIEGVRRITKGTDTLKSFLSFNGSYVTNAEGRKAHFLPYWFEEMDDGRLEMHRLGYLPDWIKKTITEEREK